MRCWIQARRSFTHARVCVRGCCESCKQTPYNRFPTVMRHNTRTHSVSATARESAGSSMTPCSRVTVTHKQECSRVRGCSVSACQCGRACALLTASCKMNYQRLPPPAQGSSPAVNTVFTRPRSARTCRPRHNPVGCSVLTDLTHGLSMWGVYTAPAGKNFAGRAQRAGTRPSPRQCSPINIASRKHKPTTRMHQYRYTCILRPLDGCACVCVRVRMRMCATFTSSNCTPCTKQTFQRAVMHRTLQVDAHGQGMAACARASSCDSTSAYLSS